MNNEKARATKVGGGKKGRFNIVDFFLLLILAVIVAAVVLYFIPGAFNRITATDETDITFVLEFRGVDEDFAANIKSGDAVYDSSRNYLLGNVKSVESYAHSQLVYNEETGTTEMKDVPGLTNLVVTVNTQAIYNYEEGYSVGGERIAVGRAYNISFPHFNGSAYCIELSAVAN